MNFDAGRRAPEAVALFNEVFTSELLVNAAWAKEQDSGTGLSWPACFLILPLALHPRLVSLYRGVLQSHWRLGRSVTPRCPRASVLGSRRRPTRQSEPFASECGPVG